MPWLLIGICSLIYLLDGLIHSVLGPLAPDLAKSLALTNAQLGPIFSANLLGQCIGLIVVPLLGVRLGQRSLVLLSLLGFGLAQAATATAYDANSLFAWRLVTGFFLGGALPSCLALVTAAAPVARSDDYSVIVLFVVVVVVVFILVFIFVLVPVILVFIFVGAGFVIRPALRLGGALQVQFVPAVEVHLFDVTVYVLDFDQLAVFVDR